MIELYEPDRPKPCVEYLLVQLLLNNAKAQTASSAPLTKYYSSLVKEKLDAGKHPASSNEQQQLPSENGIPKKAKELGRNVHVSQGNSANRKLPGERPISVDEIRERNKKWINLN